MKKICLSLALLLGPLVPGAFGQARAGSIYNPDLGPHSMIADKTARRPGDLVTVLITESQDVANEESSNFSRQTQLDYALGSFQILPDAFDPLPDLEAQSQDDFQGTANYQKSGSFIARITAMVVDRLPNGNMVLKGRREIRVDNEVKVIEFSGIVRPFDVQSDNTVLSQNVAEAFVSYTGDGEMTRTTNRYGLGRLIHNTIGWLWPF